jgi:hypothetical protein
MEVVWCEHITLAHIPLAKTQSYDHILQETLGNVA